MARGVPVEIDRGHPLHRLLTEDEGGQAASRLIRRQSLHGPPVDLRLHALSSRSDGAIQPVSRLGCGHMHGRRGKACVPIRGHQTEGVIGVQVRDEDVIDLFRPESGGTEVVQQMTDA